MIHRQFKLGVFVLEGLNSFATTYYFYYFYFFMQKQFGFGDKANLLLAALNGFVCMIAAWWGGRFGQRAGYFTALKLGFGIMGVALLIGAQCASPLAHIAVMVVTVIGMSLTWATPEALVSEGERPDRLPQNIGVYNVVWAGTGALAYFTGGALLDGLGLKSMFYVPATLFLGQLAATFWLQQLMRFDTRGVEAGQVAVGTLGLNPRPIARAKAFLRMAWFTNPFAYIAINTLIAVMPGLATRLGLSTTLAGFFGSVWCFARLGAFAALWVWPGWHYRFRWLLSAYLALIVSFAVMLAIPNLAMLMCFHNMEVRDEDPSIPSRLYCGKLKKLVHTKYDLVMKKFIPSSGILFRNGLFDDFPEWYARLPFTDWALNMMISQYGDFYCIPKVIGVYRIHGEGVWSKLSAEEGQRQSLQVLEAFTDNFRDDAQLASALEKSKAERQTLLQSGVAEPKMERSIRTKTINSLIHFLNKLK